MDIFSLTDELIDELLLMPKQIISRRARLGRKAKHTELNLDVISRDGRQTFVLFERQSLLIADDFSCGLHWIPAKGNRIILTRYNGSSHPHSNPLEGERFKPVFHIHRATQRYILANRKTEHYAQQTERYSTLEGARSCLMMDCNIISADYQKRRRNLQTDVQEDLFK